MPINYTAIAHYRSLVDRLAASTDRIANLELRLLAGTSALKPIEYDRLLDDYRNEQIRYDHISRELDALKQPKKTKEYMDGRRTYQQLRKSKVNY